ncbi:MAG: DUF3052 domain-containing protein [Microbacterium sp. SCN 70-200]|uniref:DUF3052 domain-containing protein n=2 Tax=Microbacterium TaxID=33882 RepID=UPI00086E5ED9|nr:DUF3052 domain-containing protein [Microbacterium sp.]MBN9215587.1 DUF3052 domain-containing protein [Microbacterium sp.]ODT41210.1 MAG: DUF3052 domain-containing protein [Microbacterium sp. SCN 70-200]OJV79394.1 MAG: DUF3052 domain-containing protein [Microbacterium sp. 70-16]
MKTIAEKLQIKPGNDVLIAGADASRRSLLDPLPDGVTVTEGIGRAVRDVAVIFAADRAALDARLAEALPFLAEARASWIIYPKGNRSDINRDSIWRRVEELGWTLNANVAIDDAWSAVRMKPQA